jgi:hypothetical protein
MQQRSRIVGWILIAIVALLVGTMQLVEAQSSSTIEIIQVDTSLRKKPPRPRPIPPVKSVPEPSASLCLGIALLTLAGYSRWRQKKNQV